jgi:L-threonylcarbamoyladenylate synthase
VLRRPGGITLEQVQALVPEVTTQAGESTGDGPQIAPGQLTRHYAPRAALTLFEGPPDAVVQRIAVDARTAVAKGSRVGILAPEEDLRALAPLIAPSAAAGRIEVQPYGSRADVDRAGRDLFSAIRAIDATGVDIIFASSIGTDGLARAIRDRLMRAAEGRVKTIVQY